MTSASPGTRPDAAALAWSADSRLREAPVDPRAFDAALEARIEAAGAARSQPAKLLALLGETAPLLRIAGRLEEARRTATAALALAELLEDATAVFTSQLELARVMQREGRYDLSTPLLDRLVAQARSSPALAGELHAALHAAGVNLFGQRHYREAALFLRQALGLARRPGDERLVEASAHALELARAAVRAEEGPQARRERRPA